MYIDTHTKEKMNASVCAYLGCSSEELSIFLDKIYYSQKSVEEELSDFIDENMPENTLDEVQFYHLSRRLLDDNSRAGNNLYENSYTMSLSSCPEFIEQMALVIGRKDIVRDYKKNSRYYCLEYLVPMDKVIFDGFSYNTQYSKTRHLLHVVLNRLYEYEFNRRYMYDHDNLILRLEDDDTMEEKYFITEEEIK